MMKHAISYARTRRNLAEQEKELREYARQNNIKIIWQIEDEEGKATKLPGFNKMLEFCTKYKGCVDVILIADWTNFGNDPYLCIEIAEKFTALEIEIISVWDAKKRPR